MTWSEYAVVVLIFLGGGAAMGLMWFFWIRVFMKWETWRQKDRT